MYYYILDTHGIPQKDFERNQTELQGLLTEHNINGEMARGYAIAHYPGPG